MSSRGSSYLSTLYVFQIFLQSTRIFPVVLRGKWFWGERSQGLGRGWETPKLCGQLSQHNHGRPEVGITHKSRSHPLVNTSAFLWICLENGPTAVSPGPQPLLICRGLSPPPPRAAGSGRGQRLTAAFALDHRLPETPFSHPFSMVEPQIQPGITRLQQQFDTPNSRQ